ncbi:MAG: prepilin-type N-terminal cleavage/methylation domain-containing protein [Myxococcota bacterium]
MSCRRNRAFTLIEMMVAVAVGAATVIMAAKIAAVVLQQNSLSEQKQDLSLRTRVLSEQLRADIRLAGLGSTGAIGVDPVLPALGAMAIAATPRGGFPAIPAVAGANNLGFIGLPTGTLMMQTDAIQLVVPNPISMVRTTQRARRNGNVLTFANTAALGGCPLVYIHDHSNPNGAGRTQLAWTLATAATTVSIQGSLLFTAAAGSEVYCARVSTYWVDDQGWLHRSDLNPNGGVIRLGTSQVYVTDAPIVPDQMAPGVTNLQVAYKVSAEAYRQSNPPAPVPVAPEAQWAYTAVAPNANALMSDATNPHLWFEVRLVRMNFFAVRAKRSTRNTHLTPQARAEDGDPTNEASATGGDWVVATEAVTNLKMFDTATPTLVPAEPY